MRKTLVCVYALASITAFGLTSTAVADEPPAPTTGELLPAPPAGAISQVWTAPGADLSAYRRIYLVEPGVAFRKNWLKDQNRGHPSLRVKPSDMEDIANELKALFIDVFTKELLAANYSFSEVRDHDVMIIKPAIVNLDVIAPDIQMQSTADVLTSSAGSMTLYLEIYDSVSEALIAKAMDTATDREAGSIHSQKKVANRAAFRRIIEAWAQGLGSGFAPAARESAAEP